MIVVPHKSIDSIMYLIKLSYNELDWSDDLHNRYLLHDIIRKIDTQSALYNLAII